MTTVQTRYVTWISRGRRHHGSSSLDLVPPLSSTAADPGVYQALASPQYPYTDAQGKPQTAWFAFWSVTGGANGPFVTPQNSVNVPVGDDPVNAIAWYVPLGDGNGQPGTLIDAFDVNLGNFVDDDFVSVAPDAGLGAAANEDGWVPSAALEHIQAFASIHATPLLNWQVVLQSPPGADTVVAADLQAAAQSQGVAFAFYQRPSGPSRWVDPHRYEIGTWVSWGVMVDGGGPTGHGPVDPWGPLVREFAGAMALAEAARKGGVETRAASLDIAAKQLEITAAKLGEAMRKDAKPRVKR